MVAGTGPLLQGRVLNPPLQPFADVGVGVPLVGTLSLFVVPEKGGFGTRPYKRPIRGGSLSFSSPLRHYIFI